MEAFEKWFNNFSCDTIDCGGIDCNDVCKQIRKETWKEALEWILSCDTGPETKELIESVLSNE